MTDLHTFKIHAPLNSNEAFIEIDGARMKGVTRIQFDIQAKRKVELTIKVVGYVDIAGSFTEQELLHVVRGGESIRRG